MIIAALKKKGNDVTIAIDDGTYRILDYRVVVDSGIWKGQEIDERKLELLSYESSFLKAKDSAFRYLGMRLHSTSELKLKLQKKKYSPNIIQKTIEFLRERSYLNDSEFVRQFVAERVKRKKIGSARLTVELLKRGINREMIKASLIGIIDENYFENALILAQKKLVQIKRKEKEERKIALKLFSYLTSKGYESDIIRSVIEKLELSKEE